MKNDSLVIMAGGVSSRMKRSLASSDLDDKTLTLAKNVHKSLIPLGEEQKPLLFYLLQNAITANIKNVYVVTSPENGAFKEFAQNFFKDVAYKNLKLKFAIQNVPADRVKPLGTADALQQCLDQYPKLLKERFTVCNGDNLYSIDAFKDLSKDRIAPNALISYNSSGLNFSDDRISKFALMNIDNSGYLKGIIEKPKLEVVNNYRDPGGNLRVSMNIFNFSGNVVYPYLENCLVHPIRNEKELPEAVKSMVKNNSKSVICYPRLENIPDLTDANDIKKFIG